MIPQDFLRQLLDKIDIVDVVDRYVPLKKGGQNFMACCPFHQEKTPSFTVSPAKQFFHCFGCGAHGTAIGFVMQYQGLGFVEAVEQLANSVNMSLPQTTSAGFNRASQQTYLSVEKTLEAAAKGYQTQLATSTKSLAYLKARGLSEAIIEQFGLGYAPNDPKFLLKEYPNSEALLHQAGLLSTSEDQQNTYSRFRDRIMFPIRNSKGTLIGFGARTIAAEKEPKYLNSPETVLFKKGQELYGLFEARKAIHQARRVVVVEGYMDVIALAQHGIDYAVATLGTATSSDQIRKLVHEAEDIYFCFDGDEAGHKAAHKALENSLPVIRDGKSIYFLFLPPEHDPDSFIRSYSAEVFTEKLTKESIPFSAYLIHQLVDGIQVTLAEGQAKLVQRALPWLMQLKEAPLLMRMIQNRLAELTCMKASDFDDLCDQQRLYRSRYRTYQIPQVSQRLKVISIFQKQFITLLMNPSWVEDIALPDTEETLTGEMACFALLVDTINQSPSIPSSASLIESMRGTPCGALLNQVLAEAHREGLWEDSSENARQAFREGHQRLIHDYWRTTQLKPHIDQLANKPYQTLTATEKQLSVELLKNR